VLHAPPISPSFTSYFWLYLANNTSYEAPHYAAFSTLFRPNILPSILFSNTLSLSSSLNVRVQVSHPYRTIGKMIVVYILIFTFLYSRRVDKRLLISP
jgi:hypothetical protein